MVEQLARHKQNFTTMKTTAEQITATLEAWNNNQAEIRTKLINDYLATK